LTSKGTPLNIFIWMTFEGEPEEELQSGITTLHKSETVKAK